MSYQTLSDASVKEILDYLGCLPKKELTIFESIDPRLYS